MNKTITGIVMQTNVVNKNGRMYSNEAFQSALDEYQSKIDNKTALGEIDKAESLDRSSPDIISLSNISHIVKEAWITKSRLPRKKKKLLKKQGLYNKWKNSNTRDLMATVEVLPGVREGAFLSDLLNNDCNLGIGMRAVGTEEHFDIISFDVVTK